MAISLFKSAQTGLIFRPLDFNTNMQIIEESINALLLASGTSLSDELAALVEVDAELLALAAVETELSALAAKDTELLALEAVDAELLALAAKDAELLALEAVDAELLALAAKDTELLAIETAHAAGKLFGSFGNTVSIVKTDAAAENLLDAADVARHFIAFMKVEEAFEPGDGAATVVKIGDGTVEDLYLNKNSGAASTNDVIFGKLLANKPLVITPTAATGSGTGGLTITVIAATETLPVVE